VALSYNVFRIRFDVMVHLLTDTMGLFFRTQFLFFSQGSMGKLMNSFQQEVNKVGDTFGQIAQLMANTLQVFIFLAVPFALNSKLTMLFLVTAVIFSAPLWFLHSFTYKIGKESTDTANYMTTVLHEALSAAKLILGYGRQESAVQKYKDSIVKHSQIGVKLLTIKQGVPLLFYPVGVTAALVSLYVAYLDGIAFSDMAMVLFSLTRVVPIIGLLLQGKTSIEAFIPAYEQLERLRQDAVALEEPRGGTVFRSLRDRLRFTNVSFSYPGRKPALKSVTLEVRKGQMTALLGDSGAGKTTVVDLMLGLYKQSAGNILLDGKELAEYDRNSYRQKVGYVPQEPQLFNTTVRENMLWSTPEASENDIWLACHMANAEEFVRELPDGLETILGDRGVRLSGGQRQRLALARAIIRKPDLIILDEATSSLDTESEKLIQKSIENLPGEITIVIIAHRLSTILNADYVYILEKGKIIEEGTYSQLSIKEEGYFAGIVKSQILA
jgi:ATP-binding cassette subfamily B protein